MKVQTNTKLNRRRVLLSSAAFFLLPVACKSAGTVSELRTEDDLGPEILSVRVRRRWRPEQGGVFKDHFKTAVAWLKANDTKTFKEGDPRNFLSWKKLTSMHAQSGLHRSSHFLPWHRLALQYFEAACRQALQDEGFALPYWDWTLDPQVFTEFLTDDVLASNRDWKREHRLSEEFNGIAVINRVLGSDDFYAVHSGVPDTLRNSVKEMQGLVEGSLHNRVMAAIGGDMIGLASANDPLFWLHHANLDRIWATWALKHPAAMIPPLPAGSDVQKRGESWQDAELTLSYTDESFVNGQKQTRAMPMPSITGKGLKQPLRTKVAVKELLQTDALGYTYDTLLQEPSVFINLNIAPLKRNPSILALDSQVLPSKVLQARAAMGPASKAFKAFQNAGSAVLYLTNLPKSEENGLVIRVFAIDGREVSDDMIQQFTHVDAHKSVDFIGSYCHLKGSGETVNLCLEISDWLRAHPNLKDLGIIALALGSQGRVDVFSGAPIEVQLQLSAV